MRTYTIEECIKAARKNGYTIKGLNPDNYQVVEIDKFRDKIINRLTPGNKLIRIGSSGDLYMRESSFHSFDGVINLRVSYHINNVQFIKGGWNYYRFIPLSWLKPKVAYLPEWF